jgi:hypothetical protein
MKIEIKNRFTGEVIILGEYESIKECLENNKGAYLGGADLRGADLRGAYLGGAFLRGAGLGDADLRGADLGDANLGDADLRDADLGDAYLGGAYLGDANLGGADLRDADLRGADLRGAYLGGAKNYKTSHDIFQEIVRRQKVELFVSAEWECIGQIIVHRLCWDSIRKRFPETAMSVFKKLSKVGFSEWEEYFKEQT